MTTAQENLNAAANAMGEEVAHCAQSGRTLAIVGGGSKAFYGNAPAPTAAQVSTAVFADIVEYDAGELFIACGGGAPLPAVESALAERGQMLPFDPPQFAGGGVAGGTAGGAVAAGLAGPQKPAFGGVRDSMLGVCIINGNGETLCFGGRVMKNVAGYDISRLMAGSMGTLGVIVEAIFKVLPKPQETQTRVYEAPAASVAELLSAICRHDKGHSLPLATFYAGGRLWAQFAGNPPPAAGDETLRGEQEADFWRAVRDQRHPFFANGKAPLWRLAVPHGDALAKMAAASGEDFALEWHGNVCWLHGKSAAERQQQAAAAGGVARLFRRPAGAAGAAQEGGFMPPLPAPVAAINQRLKQAFDPQGILNPGRFL